VLTNSAGGTARCSTRYRGGSGSLFHTKRYTITRESFPKGRLSCQLLHRNGRCGIVRSLLCQFIILTHTASRAQQIFTNANARLDVCPACGLPLWGATRRSGALFGEYGRLGVDTRHVRLSLLHLHAACIHRNLIACLLLIHSISQCWMAGFVAMVRSACRLG
jgi:hypothetical protein